MEKWKYKNKEIDSIDDMKIYEPNVYGFVYMISLVNKETNMIDHQYIGKKNVRLVKRKTATQKELREFPKSHFRRTKLKNGDMKYYQEIVNESDWKTYCSSNDFIKKEKDNYKLIREILLFSSSDSDLTWKEAKEIMCQDALENKFFLNNNISIKRIINNKKTT